MAETTPPKPAPRGVGSEILIAAVGATIGGILTYWLTRPQPTVTGQSRFLPNDQPEGEG